MPDYYTTFTAEETIKCSEEEFNALVKSIGIEKGVKIDGGEALTATHGNQPSPSNSPLRRMNCTFMVNKTPAWTPFQRSSSKSLGSY